MGIYLDMDSEVLVSGQDLRRWRLVEQAINKTKLQSEVSEELNLSIRQVRRLVKKAKDSGIKGLIHGLRGKTGNRAMAEKIKNQVLDIWESKYRGARLNFSHFTEKLNEVEGIKIGRESVRRLLRSKGVADRAPKKGSKHRRHRERKEQFGELLQQDTSPHDWLGVGIYPSGDIKVLHLPSGNKIKFKIIELKNIHEPKNPSELPEIQKI